MEAGKRRLADTARAATTDEADALLSYAPICAKSSDDGQKFLILSRSQVSRLSIVAPTNVIFGLHLTLPVGAEDAGALLRQQEQQNAPNLQTLPAPEKAKPQPKSSNDAASKVSFLVKSIRFSGAMNLVPKLTVTSKRANRYPPARP